MPTKPKSQPKINKDEAQKFVIIGLGLGVAASVVYKIILPSPAEQFFKSFTHGDSIMPVVLPQILITLAVLTVVGGLVLKDRLKVSYPFRNVLYVSQLATCLTIIILGKRTLGNSFLLVLPFVYIGGELLWSYIIKRKSTQIIFLLLLLPLVIYAIRILNVGKILDF